MNPAAAKHASIANSGSADRYFEPPVPPSALMLRDEATPEFEERALGAHSDARQLARLVQCPACDRSFAAPVTLPCGHTVCQRCLPPPRMRSNISYPNSLDHQLGITCPTCTQEHSTAECCVDVTFSKLMDLIKAVVKSHRAAHKNSPTLLEEIVHDDEETGVALSGEKSPRAGRTGTYHGGRLAATFEMVRQGLLAYSSDVVYISQCPTGSEFEDLDTSLLAGLRDVAHKELDCLVCYNIMLEPTTTACGHTFCRRCITRFLDHSSICPVCRRALHLPPSLDGYPNNARLSALLTSLCPDIIAARKAASRKEEQAGEGVLDTPLFICTLSLPSMPTFLHIFEPRYRLMMRRCIEGTRRFGMVMYNRSSLSRGHLENTRFVEYGTLLEILNFQLLPDGRSFVETRGVSRFRILEHGMLDGYDVGRIERIDDVSLSAETRAEQAELSEAQTTAAEYNALNPSVPLTDANFPGLLSTEELFQRCRAYVDTMRARSAPWLSSRIVTIYGEPPEDPAVFPYWFAAVMPVAEEEKYRLLGTTRVRERLIIVFGWIRRIEGQRWPAGNACLIL